MITKIIFMNLISLSCISICSGGDDNDNLQKDFEVFKKNIATIAETATQAGVKCVKLGSEMTSEIAESYHAVQQKKEQVIQGYQDRLSLKITAEKKLTTDSNWLQVEEKIKEAHYALIKEEKEKTLTPEELKLINTYNKTNFKHKKDENELEIKLKIEKINQKLSERESLCEEGFERVKSILKKKFTPIIVITPEQKCAQIKQTLQVSAQAHAQEVFGSEVAARYEEAPLANVDTEEKAKIQLLLEGTEQVVLEGANQIAKITGKCVKIAQDTLMEYQRRKEEQEKIEGFLKNKLIELMRAKHPILMMQKNCSIDVWLVIQAILQDEYELLLVEIKKPFSPVLPEGYLSFTIETCEKILRNAYKEAENDIKNELKAETAEFTKDDLAKGVREKEFNTNRAKENFEKHLEMYKKMQKENTAREK